MSSSNNSLSHKAEIFQSKLIEEFQLLEAVSEQGRRRAPVYNSSDIIDPALLEDLLVDVPEQTIKFKVYKTDHPAPSITVDRRLTRVRNQNKLPLGVWAKWITESEKFQVCVMLLIVINSITIGIQAELPVSDNVGLVFLEQLLLFIDLFSLVAFFVDIGLKWTSSFRNFWTDSWNIFDLLITTLSALPSLIGLFYHHHSRTAQQLRGFRIIRTLKIIPKFGSLRIIVLTVLQAFQSMLFITFLLLTAAYIYALIGVISFESYSTSERTDLNYSTSFSTLPNALITLFQLVTFDQWYNIYQDISKVSNKVFTSMYILLWIWVGAFVFRNLFVGIMVNNFQSISSALVQEELHQNENEELARMKEELHTELVKHDLKMLAAKTSMVSLNVHFPDETDDKDNEAAIEEEKISEGWDRTVHSHLLALASDPKETLWPRDTLFKYLQLMERLQENLEEYDQLQELARECLLSIHDETSQQIQTQT